LSFSDAESRKRCGGAERQGFYASTSKHASILSAILLKVYSPDLAQASHNPRIDRLCHRFIFQTSRSRSVVMRWPHP
jgi:hypothetical protein